MGGFTQRTSSSDTIEYKIGEVFGEIENKFRSGYSLRDALELMDGLRFRSQQEKHELSHLYEAKIRNMGDAGRNGGEYYTPKPLIRAMVKVTDPTLGETIYDGACGSAGFLCEAPNIIHTNMLSENLADIQQRDRYDIILANPPFGGKERKEVQQNFPIKTGETAFNKSSIRAENPPNEQKKNTDTPSPTSGVCPGWWWAFGQYFRGI